MTTIKYVNMIDSRFVSISGEDKSDFLQGLITNDIKKCDSNMPIYSCLLSPQGRFVADFFIINFKNKYLIEIHDKFLNEFLNKLKIYKLRSRININEEKNFVSLVILKDNNLKLDNNIIKFDDPRNRNLGKKIYSEKNITKDFINKFNLKEVHFNIYRELLIKNLIPYSPFDLQENKSLLLENNFDNINAISWDKGCFVGQEITARMKYRALLKKQLYALELISGSIEIGDKIKEKEVNLGEVISKANQYIFCILKIELVKEKSEKKALLEIDSTTTLKFL